MQKTRRLISTEMRGMFYNKIRAFRSTNYFRDLAEPLGSLEIMLHSAVQGRKGPYSHLLSLQRESHFRFSSGVKMVRARVLAGQVPLPGSATAFCSVTEAWLTVWHMSKYLWLWLPIKLACQGFCQVLRLADMGFSSVAAFQ